MYISMYIHLYMLLCTTWQSNITHKFVRYIVFAAYLRLVHGGVPETYNAIHNLGAAETQAAEISPPWRFRVKGVRLDLLFGA